MLDLLILRTLQVDNLHGWAIAERIHQLSDEVLFVQQGSLYPALHRLQARGWIRAEWGTAESGRRAKFYSLTRTGTKRLEREQANWERLSGAITLVLRRA